MDSEQIEQLEQFVSLCQIKPNILQIPELKFFRDWLISLGATIPSSDDTENPPKREDMKKEEPEPVKEESTDESDLEIDMEGVIEGDKLEDEEEMDTNIEVTEEIQDAADAKRDEGLTQFRQGNHEEAIKLLTEAIKINPGCSMYYAKRACCYLKLQRPNAAIRDSNKSIKLNPDSAQGYKWRGLSHKLLGNWEQSFDDLTLSLRLDYSDDAYESMKQIEPKIKRIREHKRKYERKREEKDLRERRERVRKAQEANEKAKKESEEKGDYPGFGGGMPSGMGGMPGGMGGMPGGMGGMPGGMGGMPGGMGGLNDILGDPEMLEDMKDPEVMKILSEMMTNPAAMMKHQDNPKIQRIMKKMQGKFGAGATGGADAGAGFSMDAEDIEEADKAGNSKPAPKVNTCDDLD